MPATREQLIEASKKGMKSPNVGKRGKSKTTIALEEARSIWAAKQLEHLPKLAEVQSKEALKPKNRQEREYVLNQLLGKAKETVEMGGKDGEPIPIAITQTLERIYGKDKPSD